MITAVVPVKAYSERLKDKNLRTFIDCSLYEHKLRQLQAVPFDRIVVSSESKEILRIAEVYGYQTHHREEKYSTPSVPMNKVWQYVCSEVPGDDIAWVNVTNPLVTGDMYAKAILLYKQMKDTYDCLLSVYNMQKYLFWKGKPVNWNPSEHPKSQDLEGLYAMSFAINIRNREEVIKYGCFTGKKPFFYMLNRYTSTKIDYPYDLEFCRMIWKSH